MNAPKTAATAPKVTLAEHAALTAAGWFIGPHDKWWRPKADNGSRYPNTPRAFRYIQEDGGLT